MAFEIDCAFIREWHPKYDLIENDEGKYQLLIGQVVAESNTRPTVLSVNNSSEEGSWEVTLTRTTAL